MHCFIACHLRACECECDCVDKNFLRRNKSRMEIKRTYLMRVYRCGFSLVEEGSTVSTIPQLSGSLADSWCLPNASIGFGYSPEFVKAERIIGSLSDLDSRSSTVFFFLLWLHFFAFPYLGFLGMPDFLARLFTLRMIRLCPGKNTEGMQTYS